MTNKIIIILAGCLFFSSWVIAAKQRNNLGDDIALFEQGVLLSVEKDWAAAEMIFRDVASRNPDWPEPKNNLAIALYNAGKLEQAQKALDDAVTSSPSFKVAQANRQRLYELSATMAYYKAVGITDKPATPKLDLLTAIHGAVITNVPVTPAPAKPVAVKVTKPEIIECAPPAPAPVVASGGCDSALPVDALVEQITDSVINWANAWGTNNIEQYLASYSKFYRPADLRLSNAVWQKQRREKFRYTKVDVVKLKSIKVFLNIDRTQALVEFVQYYKSNKYQDSVVKQMRVTNEAGRWRIMSEIVLEQLG